MYIFKTPFPLPQNQLLAIAIGGVTSSNGLHFPELGPCPTCRGKRGPESGRSCLLLDPVRTTDHLSLVSTLAGLDSTAVSQPFWHSCEWCGIWHPLKPWAGSKWLLLWGTSPNPVRPLRDGEAAHSKVRATSGSRHPQGDCRSLPSLRVHHYL